MQNKQADRQSQSRQQAAAGKLGSWVAGQAVAVSDMQSRQQEQIAAAWQRQRRRRRRRR